VKQGSSYALDVGGLTVTVQRKAVKYLRLRIREPEGSLYVSAPLRVSDRDLQRFVESKRSWIERQQARCVGQARAPHAFEDGSAVPLWGGERTLRFGVGPNQDADTILLLPARPGQNRQRRQAALHAWYRSALKDAIAQRLPYWEQRVGARAEHWWVRNMRSRWGSCSFTRRRICISLRMVVHPVTCLDYVLVHELAHLRVPRHDRAFWSVVADAMPDWQSSHHRLRAARQHDELWS